MLEVGKPYPCSVCGNEFVAWLKKSTHRRCPPCHRVAKRASDDKNREKIRVRARAWRLANPEWCRKHAKEKNARNKGTLAARWQRRVVWLADGDVTFAELQAIYLAAGAKCHWCGEITTVSPRFHPQDPRGFDHVVPRSRGGKHTASNIVVACVFCNVTRSDRHDEPPGIKGRRPLVGG
jgi:5-methylcytosine-specific restriction endonuclease McrA/DNA-directed RNA polymerase subunit RPC12/RpoP